MLVSAHLLIGAGDDSDIKEGGDQGEEVSSISPPPCFSLEEGDALREDIAPGSRDPFPSSFKFRFLPSELYLWRDPDWKMAGEGSNVVGALSVASLC